MSMKGPDPTKVAGNVYKVILENERVRVFDVHFKAGDKAIMHWHPDHIGYFLTGGKLRLTMGDGTTNEIDAPAGQAIFLKSQSHEATNIGKTDVRAIVIELK